MNSKPSAGRLRVALLGAGGIASKHAQVLKSIPETDLVAVCDLVPIRARQLADECGIPKVFSSLDEMVQQERPDVIHVLTPPQSHVALAMECLRLGCHVLVEKPLGLSSVDCERLRAAGERKGLLVGVNHNMTFSPALDRVVEVIRSRRLGRVNHVSLHFSAPEFYLPFFDPGNYMFQSPTNMIFEFGPHPFSVIHRLMGRVVRAETFASGEHKLASGKTYFDTWQIPLICDRGTASVCLVLGKGMLHCSLTVLGEDGVAKVDMGRGTVQVSEYGPYNITGPFREAVAHSRTLLRTAAGSFFDYWGAATGRLASRTRSDVFVGSLSAYYRARRAGTVPREDVNSGIEVVEYCEEAARNVTFASSEKEVLANVAN